MRCWLSGIVALAGRVRHSASLRELFAREQFRTVPFHDALAFRSTLGKYFDEWSTSRGRQRPHGSACAQERFSNASVEAVD